ncbi:MAG: hypothetical protein GC155_16725 [Alphaproteobacteria bacterium]|nr:hypothetical protein [Alphaproteobacteria bacterium]
MQLAPRLPSPTNRTLRVRNKMIAKFVLIGAIGVAITPAVASLVAPRAPLMVNRSVDLSPGIVSFTQHRDHVSIRTSSGESTSRRVVVIQGLDARGDVIGETNLKLRRGQTFASASLPHNVAASVSLKVSVD